MDGTILNTEIIYRKILIQLCENYGKKFTKEFENKVFGRTDKQIAMKVVNELQLPVSLDEFEQELIDLSGKMLVGAPTQKGAKRLLNHLYKNKIPLALATNSTRHAVMIHALARPELFGLFHHTVCVNDPEVYRAKPYPDVFLVAAGRFPDKPKPQQCLVFEDSPVGVEAGRQAGMQVVMIPDPYMNRKKTLQATIVIRSLADFKPEIFGLPAFEQI